MNTPANHEDKEIVGSDCLCVLGSKNHNPECEYADTPAKCTAGCCSYNEHGEKIAMCGLNECNHPHCHTQPAHEEKCCDRYTGETDYTNSCYFCKTYITPAQEWRKRCIEIAKMADRRDDKSYGPALARLAVDIEKTLDQHSARLVERMEVTLRKELHNLNLDEWTNDIMLSIKHDL